MQKKRGRFRKSNSKWKEDLRRLFWRTGSPQRPIQSRATLPKKKQRHQNIEHASPQQSIRCGRPRTQETNATSSVNCKDAPETKIVSIGFIQRVWKLIPAEALTNIDCEPVNISWHFTNARQQKQVVMKPTQFYDCVMFWQTCQVLSKLSVGTKKSGSIMVLQSIQPYLLWQRFPLFGKGTNTTWATAQQS